MAGRYERINVHDDDPPSFLTPIPSSPPPSFHSRPSSPTHHVDTTLADAFDDTDEGTDDESDDRQRLVRQNSTPHTPLSPVHPQPTPAPRSTRVIGAGSNDGVFANMSARPERSTSISEKDEMPPTYEQAAADAVPPYWEMTILAPGMGGLDEVYVDGLPVGSIFSFIWNCMISTSFQLVGFLLTYLLHSTHAAKHGSRAGLGITMIQYGFYMKAGPTGDAPPVMNGPDGYAMPPSDPNAHDFDAGDVTDGAGGLGDVSGGEWVAYMLMVGGWFILIKSIAEFLRARRHEQLVLQSPDRGLGTAVVGEGESADRVV